MRHSAAFSGLVPAMGIWPRRSPRPSAPADALRFRPLVGLCGVQTQILLFGDLERIDRADFQYALVLELLPEFAELRSKRYCVGFALCTAQDSCRSRNANLHALQRISLVHRPAWRAVSAWADYYA